MYSVLELLTVVFLVVVLAAILFAAGAAVIVIDEAARWVLELLVKSIAQVPSFSTPAPKGRKLIISRPLVSLDSKAGKL